MTQTLDDLLSLFLKREEIAPNVFRVSLAVGEHLVGVEIRAPDGALFLRALPLEALPETLARHAGVKERITHFGDIVKSGRLGRDDAGRPILEVDLAGLDGSRETYFGVLEAVAIDCARLRGAAEGLVAGLEMAAAMGARTPAPAAPPAATATPVPGATKTHAPLDAPQPGRTRLWESMLQQALPPSLQKLAQQKREETLEKSAAIKAEAVKAEAAKAEAVIDAAPGTGSGAPAAPGAAGFRLGGVPAASQPFAAPPGLSPMEPPSEPPSTWEDLERELLGANPENPPSQHTGLGMIPAPPKPQTPAALAGAESSQIFATLSGAGGAPTRAQEDSGSDVFSGAPPKAGAVAGLTDSFLEDLPSSMASPPKSRGEEPAAPPPRRTSLFGGPGGAKPPEKPAPAPGAEAEGDAPARPKKMVGFFGGGGAPGTGGGAPASPASDQHAGAKNRKSLFQPGGAKDKATSSTGNFSRADVLGGGAGAPLTTSADPFTEAPAAPPSQPKAPAGATRRFDKYDLGPAAPLKDSAPVTGTGSMKGPAPMPGLKGDDGPPLKPKEKDKEPKGKGGKEKEHIPAHRGPPEKLPGGGGGGQGGANASTPPVKVEISRPAAAAGSGGGDNVLSWMDDVEGGGGDVAEEEPPPRRSASLVIPKALLIKVKDTARDWYRRQDRENVAVDLKKGNDALFVSTGEVPGESSWRFRKQTLRLSRPPIEAGTATYFPEPQELTVEEVEAWLLSEQMLREEDIDKAHRAHGLFEGAWALRAEGKLGEAEGALREVLELQPDNVLAMTALGHLYRKELGKPDEALKLYGKVLEKAPKFAAALLGRAALQVESDRHKAYEEAMAALALSPRDPDLLELAGIVAMRANRKARAKELFVKLFRVDRSRGEAALELVDVERAGEAKWDPRIVVWERPALAKGGLESVLQALYEERVALAKKFDDLLREYKDLTPEQKRQKLQPLHEQPSYSFLFDVLPHYVEETDEGARAAVESLFKSAPAQASMALEDAVLSGDHDRAIAALRLAGVCGLHELVKPALEGFRRMSLTRHVRAMSEELVKIGGGDAALALLAKLERGEREPMDALMELLSRRPEEGAEEAAAAIHSALSVKGGVALEEDDRDRLLSAAEPSAEALAERSSSLMKKEARMKRLKELEEELGGATPKKKGGGAGGKKDGEEEG